MGPGRTAVAIALTAAIASAPLPASALLGDSDGAVGLDGSIRSVALAIANYDEEAIFGDHEFDALSQTLVRLVVAGRPSARWAFEVHALQSIDYATTSAAAGGAGASGAGLPIGGSAALRYRALDATWQQDDRGDARLALALDRAALRLSVGRFDLTLGRQAITFGKTLFWSPLDVFLPFDPRQLDRDYKPGVDALRADVSLGDFSGLSLVAVAGRTLDASGRARERGSVDASWFGSAVLVRAFATVAGWDVSLQGGKVYGGYQAGAGVVGEIAGVDLRGEASLLCADGSPPLNPLLFGPNDDLVESGVGVVLGAGRRFESSLDLHGEYFFNGEAGRLDESFARFLAGNLLNASRHLVGFGVSYELTPLLLGSLAWIVSADDGSGQIVPSLSWSAADDIDVVFGLLAAYGERPRADALGRVEPRSEFGTFPTYLYVEPKLYF